MKKLLAAVALATLLTSPAFAKTHSQLSSSENSGPYAADPAGYGDDGVNGDTVGRDPDLNIRFQLTRDPPKNMQ